MVDMRSHSMPIPSELMRNPRKPISQAPNWHFRLSNRGHIFVVVLALSLRDAHAPSRWSYRSLCRVDSVQPSRQCKAVGSRQCRPAMWLGRW